MIRFHGKNWIAYRLERNRRNRLSCLPCLDQLTDIWKYQQLFFLHMNGKLTECFVEYPPYLKQFWMQRAMNIAKLFNVSFDQRGLFLDEFVMAIVDVVGKEVQRPLLKIGNCRILRFQFIQSKNDTACVDVSIGAC